MTGTVGERVDGTVGGPAGAPAGGSTGWSVPQRVEVDGEVVVVARAWPGKEKDGVARVTVEGRDLHGRLRAGSLRQDGRVRLLPAGVDPALPALERLAPEGELLVHRAGRRAVLRHTGGYTKVVRPGRSAAVVAAASTGGTLAAAAGLAAPQVVHHDPEQAAVTLSVLPGRPVHELAAGRDWERIWTTWASAWVRLQGLDEGAVGVNGSAGAPLTEPARDGAAGLARHTAEDEAGVVGRWADQALTAGLLPAVWGERAGAVAARLRDAGDPERMVPTHRDLHDKQLLWDGDTLGVLDLDTACVADPALDPANLAVHADLRRAQGIWSTSAASAVEVSAEVVARVAQVDEERWGTAQLATVVRLACVYAFRPAWRDVVLAWAEQRWEGLAA
ncbi:phosphotransferase [Ornithinimicrobium pekingense]|uniref:Aminoglycoside phosphotransferase domain-containing protein n=1 Tax=Ornithinimicrobium pekingense TaxID=384677 RepID=A0ABQ2FC22_9MICO|nr:phosphotransferase [Ornithinimicrobium pekingense]GGK78857.1 hypothetical protein GCM10011509_29260 [Ornithinimicrobium pekingense]